MSKTKQVIEQYKQNKQEYLANIHKEKNFINRFKKRLPNILTKSRIIAPFLIVPAAIFGNFIIATIIAGAFGLTDAFDGLLARKWHATSEYGRKLDVISDKMFALGLILPLLITNPFIILPTLILEFAIGFISTKAELNNRHPKSTLLGKVKTNFLYITLTTLFLSKCINLPINYLLPLIGLTNVSQLATAIQYQCLSKTTNEKKNNDIKKEDIKSKDIKNKDIQQEIREYQYLKESLLEEPVEEKEFVKTKRYK